MKIALVCTRGGHLTESLQLLEAFHGMELFIVVPHSGRDAELLRLRRVIFSRDVNASIVGFLELFFWSFGILRREKPDVVISMGPEIAIPFFLWGRIMGMKTLYIESWCRVHTLSLTGKLVYSWVDEFWVQWPHLVEQYPRAKFFGSVL